MMFLIDECVPHPSDIVTFLESQGHKAFTAPAGTLDTEVHIVAQREEAIILTLDLGFLKSTVKTPGRKPVVIFQLRDSRKNIKNAKPYVIEALRVLQLDQPEEIHVITSKHGSMTVMSYMMRPQMLNMAYGSSPSFDYLG